MKPTKLLVIAVLLALLIAPMGGAAARAQGEPTPPTPADDGEPDAADAPPRPGAGDREGEGALVATAEESNPEQDYRGRVITAVSLMFIFIVGFVLWSQMRGGAMRDELDHLRRRIDELEAKKPDA